MLHLFPSKPLYDAIDRTTKFLPEANRQNLAGGDPGRAKMSAMEAKLCAMPAEEVSRLAAEARAKKEQAQRDQVAAAEQARFYNQPQARANFDFWLKVESWTVEEAAALLLGSEPSVVNQATLAAELQEERGLLFREKPNAPTKFHESFAQLRLLMSRASSLPKSNLRPADIVAWAREAGAVPLPSALDSRFPLIALPLDATHEHSPDIGSVVADGIDIGTKGDPKRWTDARTLALKAYVVKYSVRQAAEVWQVSEQRVRQLMQDDAPVTAKPASVFNYRQK